MTLTTNYPYYFDPLTFDRTVYVKNVFYRLTDTKIYVRHHSISPCSVQISLLCACNAMVITSGVDLKSDEKLSMKEVSLSTSALRAGAFHLGQDCEKQNNEFLLCRQELKDPRKCLHEGSEVTDCALTFFKKVKLSCYEEYMLYAKCLDQNSGTFDYEMCRKTQGVFDKCMMDNFKMERPNYGYYARAHVHHTDRSAPIKEQLKIYPDATPSLPDDYPRAPAKYGSRFHWLE